MKNILLTLALLLTLSTMSYAQDLITARDAYEASIEGAKTVLESPKLISIITSTTEDIDFGGITLEVNFNTLDGTSNLWVIVFGEENNIDEKAVYVVGILPFVGITTFPLDPDEIIDDSEGNLEFNLFIEDENWIDSPVFMEIMNKHNPFLDYQSSYGDDAMFDVVLINSIELIESREVGDYWGIIAQNSTNDDVLGCGLELATSFIICEGITSVKEITYNDKLEFYPNPANDVLNITNNNGSIISIHDIYGNKVLDISDSFGNHSINISNLPTGTYFIQAVNGHKISTEQLMIVR